MTPVLTYRNGDWQPYLPGSSLKGVIRSHVEKVTRTLNPTPGVVCNPFQRVESGQLQVQDNRLLNPQYPDVSCGDKFEIRKRDEPPGRGQWRRDVAELDTDVVYADSCPVCRLFGSTSFIGRVSFGDAYFTGSGPVRTELRDGVGIDRLTGGAANRAKFDLETLPSGVRFSADVALRNFECWQLGALLLVVQDLRDGFLRIGSGRSRGFGAVRGWIDETNQNSQGTGLPSGLAIHYLGRMTLPEPHQIWGLGKFLQDSSYGTLADDILAVEAQPEPQRRGARLVTAHAGDELEQLSQAAIAAFVARMQNWQVPAGMTWDALQWRRTEGRR